MPGVTPKRFILETRLAMCASSSKTGAMSMTEIAFETGFSDSAHLATAFKQKYGQPPTTFR
ncbi:helix-turn-helix transcriptional regulator [Rhizobium tubonense]|nr:helix-turn-helix transcriptional regulator [Rhizobium tubonense]